MTTTPSWETFRRGLARESEPQVRYLLYSHDAMGLGHLRRNLRVGKAVLESDPGASVLLVTGSDAVEVLGVPPGIDVLKLPGLRKLGNDRYEARHLALPADDIRALRASLLEAVVRSYRPDVLLADKHPVGVRGELRPALRALRSAGGRAALGLRDILDDAVTVRREWWSHDLANVIATYYDEVLIYGQREIFDPVTEYAFSDILAARTSFCGYVADPQPLDTGPFAELPATVRPRVLASAGGGEDGRLLLEACLEAATDAAWATVVVTGPLTDPSDLEVLRHMAEVAGADFYCAVPDLQRWFGAVDALVCMGGYNTLVEAVASGTPTVCVPRVKPRAEQQLRARAFARSHLIHLLDPAQLNASTLNATVEAALVQSRNGQFARNGNMLDLAGAHAAARVLTALGDRSGGAVPAGSAPALG